MQNPGTVFITGCSTGIGRAMATAFAASGHRVFATARNPDTLAEIAGDRIRPLALDVTSPTSIEPAVEAVLAEAGRIDVLVNNAGYGQMGPILDLTLQQVRDQFETNVIGVLAMMQAVAPSMIAQRAGRIVNVGSVSAILATPFSGAYCASKAALHSISEAARMELAPFGIDVIIVQPGGVRSHFGETAASRLLVKPDSPYKQFSSGIDRRAKASQEHGAPVDDVARAIVQAVTRERPPAIVRVGHGGYLLPALKRILPTRRLDRMLMQRFGLG